jgi:peptide-methionine (S)-S-oxide reductase
MAWFANRKQRLVAEKDALPGRAESMAIVGHHVVLDTSMVPPFPDNSEQALFALGCFWGAERVFWQVEGVITTAVGYSGGYTPNPSYSEVCSTRTGHAESVLVVFDPEKTTYANLVGCFFESHDPTHYMRQGNDIGTQYRSAIYTYSRDQDAIADDVRTTYAARLTDAGFRAVVTEIAPAGPFYYAEDYHQQYLAKDPNGYCGLGGTGVACPVGLLGAN